MRYRKIFVSLLALGIAGSVRAQTLTVAGFNVESGAANPNVAGSAVV